MHGAAVLRKVLLRAQRCVDACARCLEVNMMC